MYLKFFMRYWLQTFSDMLGWHKIWIDDVIMVTPWPRYNFQTRYKMRTRLCISSSTYRIDFKLGQMSWGDKGITPITSSWLSRDLCTMSRPDSEWGLYFVVEPGSKVARYLHLTGPQLHWNSQKLHMPYWLQTLLVMLGWQKNYITEGIMLVTWLGYNLITKNKNGTRAY